MDPMGTKQTRVVTLHFTSSLVFIPQSLRVPGWLGHGSFMRLTILDLKWPPWVTMEIRGCVPTSRAKHTRFLRGDCYPRKTYLIWQRMTKVNWTKYWSYLNYPSSNLRITVSVQRDMSPRKRKNRVFCRVWTSQLGQSRWRNLDVWAPQLIKATLIFCVQR